MAWHQSRGSAALKVAIPRLTLDHPPLDRAFPGLATPFTVCETPSRCPNNGETAGPLSVPHPVARPGHTARNEGPSGLGEHDRTDQI